MKKNMISVLLLSFLITGFMRMTVFAGDLDALVDTDSGLTEASCNISYNLKPVVYSNSFSCAWSALGTAPVGNIVQVGWAVENSSPYNGNALYFFGWINNDGVYHELYTGYGPSIGSTHNFEAVNKNGSGVGIIDNTQYFSEPLNWVPNGIKFSGEIANTDAAYPGKSSYHENFTDVYVYKNGAWIRPLPTAWEIDGPAGQDRSNFSSNYSFGIWDTRY